MCLRISIENITLNTAQENEMTSSSSPTPQRSNTGKKGRAEILEIVRRMYRYLHDRRAVPSLRDLGRRVLNSIERALFTVGVICRYVDFDDNEKMSDADQEDSKTKLDSLIGLTMSQFEKKILYSYHNKYAT